MEKSVSLWALLSAFGIFIVLGTSIPGELFSMFISGIIPGTTYTLPLWFVMTVYPIVAITALFWIASQPIYIGESYKPVKENTVIKTTPVKAKKSIKKQPVLKRRTRTAS